MKDNIIDFCAVRKQHQNNRSAELDDLSEKVEAMDMDAAIRYLIGMEGGSRELATRSDKPKHSDMPGFLPISFLEML